MGEILDISKSEAKVIIKRNINEWQHSWDTGNTGQLYAVQREVGTVGIPKRSTKEENIITRRTYQDR